MCPPRLAGTRTSAAGISQLHQGLNPINGSPWILALRVDPVDQHRVEGLRLLHVRQVARAGEFTIAAVAEQAGDVPDLFR